MPINAPSLNTNPSAQARSARSGLLPVLREQLLERPGSNVLDLGSPASGVLDCLAGTFCRVYCDTASTALPTRFRRQQLTLDNLATLVDAVVPRSGPVAFDVIMLWHYLDYLERELIPAFLQRVINLCRPGAWLYFMTHQGTAMPAASGPLRVTAEGMIEFSCEQTDNIAPRYPARLFSDWVPGCRMYKFYLMQNCVQENLFQYDGAAARTRERNQMEDFSAESLPSSSA